LRHFLPRVREAWSGTLVSGRIGKWSMSAGEPWWAVPTLRDGIGFAGAEAVDGPLDESAEEAEDEEGFEREQAEGNDVAGDVLADGPEVERLGRGLLEEGLHLGFGFFEGGGGDEDFDLVVAGDEGQDPLRGGAFSGLVAISAAFARAFSLARGRLDAGERGEQLLLARDPEEHASDDAGLNGPFDLTEFDVGDGRGPGDRAEDAAQDEHGDEGGEDAAFGLARAGGPGRGHAVFGDVEIVVAFVHWRVLPLPRTPWTSGRWMVHCRRVEGEAGWANLVGACLPRSWEGTGLGGFGSAVQRSGVVSRALDVRERRQIRRLAPKRHIGSLLKNAYIHSVHDTTVPEATVFPLELALAKPVAHDEFTVDPFFNGLSGATAFRGREALFPPTPDRVGSPGWGWLGQCYGERRGV
jgi:hypothetical protein